MESGIKHTRGTELERVYNFIVEFMKKNGYAPSIREICAGTNLRSTAMVYSYLEMLEMLGKIEVKRKSARAIKVIGFQFVKMEEDYHGQ